MSRKILPWLLFTLTAASCGKGAQEPRSAAPLCKSGPFSTQLARVMPPLSTVTAVELGEPGKIKKNVEPGCMVPFRDESADSKLRFVGRVDVELADRSGKEVTKVGHGGLYIGRGRMTLTVKNDAGDEQFLLAVDGRRVVLRRKGEKPVKTSVAIGGTSPLELPFDALIAALEGCDADVRLGATEDVSVVEARRGANHLWRTRWMDPEQPNAVDTSFLCSEDDAILAWRSQAGNLGWSLVVVSVRSPLTLIVKQQTRSETEADPNETSPQVDFGAE
ncbi:MAG: hypothetical protein ACXVEF_24705 [Polyangiales bacterium]